MSDLKSYLPLLYNGIKESDYIMESEQPQVDDMNAEFKLAYNRQTIANADSTGVAMYEKILNINSYINTESLEDRKQRVIIQLTTSPPFSFNFLLQQLDKIAGVGNYKAWVDYNNYTLYIQSGTSNKLWANELSLLLAKIKPTNLLYVYIGYNKTDIGIKSKTSYKLTEWKYKLDGTWKLGEYPFYYEQFDYKYKLDGTWKLGEYPFVTKSEGVDMGTNNVKQIMLNRLAEYTKSIVDNIYINNEDVCKSTEFNLFLLDNNILQIEFVYPLLNKNISKEITNIKIRDVDNNVLVEKDLYIAVDESVTVHLDINILEVLS